MYFELYADSLFLLNFTISLSLLYLTDKKVCGTATPRRLFCGSVIGSIIFLLPLFWNIPMRFAVLFGWLAEVLAQLLITFRIRSLKGFVRTLEVFGGYGLIAGSILLLLIRCVPWFLAIMGNVVWECVLLSGISLFLILCKRFDKAEDGCEAILYFQEKKLTVQGVWDSGNLLTEPISRQPVSVIGQETLNRLTDEKIPEYYRVIPYHSVGRKNGMMKGYLIHRLDVIRNGMSMTFYDVYVAVSEEAGEKIILNPRLLLRCQGQKSLP